MRQGYGEDTGHLLAMYINYFSEHLVIKKVNTNHVEKSTRSISENGLQGLLPSCCMKKGHEN